MNNKEMKELIKTKWKNNFNKEQLNQMLWGLEDNLDVSLYAKPEIQHSEMKEIRRNLLKDKLIKNNYKISTKKTSEITLEEINKMRIKLKHNNLH